MTVDFPVSFSESRLNWLAQCRHRRWFWTSVGQENRQAVLHQQKCGVVTFLQRWLVCQQNSTLKAKPGSLVGRASTADASLHRFKEPKAHLISLFCLCDLQQSFISPLLFSRFPYLVRGRISSSLWVLPGWNHFRDLVIFAWWCLKSLFSTF